MLHRRRHVEVDDRHLDEMERPLVVLLRDHCSYKEFQKKGRHLFVVENQYLLVGVDLVDVRQILDALNLGVRRPFLDVAFPLVVVADAELRHQLKMDCYLVAVDAALP